LEARGCRRGAGAGGNPWAGFWVEGRAQPAGQPALAAVRGNPDGDVPSRVISDPEL